MLILLIQLFFDSGELSLNGVFFLLDGGNFLIQLILPLLALLQLVFDIARTLSLTHLALQQHDLVI